MGAGALLGANAGLLFARGLEDKNGLEGGLIGGLLGGLAGNAVGQSQARSAQLNRMNLKQLTRLKKNRELKWREIFAFRKKLENLSQSNVNQLSKPRVLQILKEGETVLNEANRELYLRKLILEDVKKARNRDAAELGYSYRSVSTMKREIEIIEEYYEFFWDWLKKKQLEG